MPCAPVDPNYRESILRVFDDHLRPFVRAFRVGWPLDITADTVRAAMAQCTALEAYVATFPSHDGDRLRILQWLYPPFSLPRPVGKLCYWGSISPLNLLPFLYDPSRDHLSDPMPGSAGANPTSAARDRWLARQPDSTVAAGVRTRCYHPLLSSSLCLFMYAGRAYDMRLIV